MAAADDSASRWSVYLLRCADGSLYTGIATDVERRLLEHGGSDRGAKYLRGKGPLQLELVHEVGDRSAASRLEHRIKRLPKAAKEALLIRPEVLEQLLSELELTA